MCLLLYIYLHDSSYSTVNGPYCACYYISIYMILPIPLLMDSTVPAIIYLSTWFLLFHCLWALLCLLLYICLHDSSYSTVYGPYCTYYQIAIYMIPPIPLFMGPTVPTIIYLSSWFFLFHFLWAILCLQSYICLYDSCYSFSYPNKQTFTFDISKHNY